MVYKTKLYLRTDILTMAARMFGSLSTEDEARNFAHLLADIVEGGRRVKVKFVVGGLGPPVIIEMETPNINMLFISEILSHATALFDVVYKVKIYI
jgi:hypothetical protein